MAVGTHQLPGEFVRACDDGLFYCFSSWASNVTIGLFWFMALISFCIAIFLASKNLGASRAFGFSSFVGMIGGIFLSVLKLMPWWMGSSFIIVGLIGLAVMMISER